MANKLSHAPPSLSGGRETLFPRLPLDDSGGSETPRRLGDGKVSEKLTSADALLSLSLSSEPESLSSLSRVGKNPGFFFKNQPSGFFWVFLGFFGFLVFWVFFGFFLYICPEERVFRVFSVSRIL
jgi:hypothetical protein